MEGQIFLTMPVAFVRSCSSLSDRGVPFGFSATPYITTFRFLLMALE